MTMLVPGSAAPEFALPDQHGTIVTLAGLRGHWVLLWWYPAAQTPGCTIEGQNLRDHADDFAAANCVVLGASFDTVAGNLAFAEIQGFGFSLLSDEDRTAGAAYDVIRHGDDHYERFAARHSYLIDPDGIIRRSYDVSEVESHADEVLDDLRALAPSTN
ncbi:MAG: alkyl hydroperoxide reductase/Thiol specific antioxidant/Mal allergen [Acidimicrobiales bacterium]|nr:alkyl hydroperoxide reductase/Thiol specific antioxidant/Mal allergen [Acidimicrobiales bacterium]